MAEKAEKNEKAEKKGEAGAEKGGKGAETAAKSGGGLLTKMPVLLGAAMIIEAVVLFAGFKFLGGGAKPVNGADLVASEPGKSARGEGGAAAEKPKSVEIPVLEFKAVNKLSGRTILYDGSIVLSTKVEFEDKVKAIIHDREALIKDRVRTIIAQSDPDKLEGGTEPGLETLRRQIKYQLDEIVGEGMIDEVLVPRCIPYPSPF